MQAKIICERGLSEIIYHFDFDKPATIPKMKNTPREAIRPVFFYHYYY